MRQSELKLDGNAVGGLLREVFGIEMTSADSTCASCSSVRKVGSLAVYANAPGIVVRCPGCEQVLMRIVRGRGRVWLDLTGTRCLEFVVPGGEDSA
jgi:Family of unknown function (DUF6510)